MVGFGGSEVFGQGKNRHATWTQITKSVSGKPGDKVEVQVKVSLVPKSHLYTEKTYAFLGPQPTEVTVGEKSILIKNGKLRSNQKVKPHYDENFSDIDSVFTEYWEGTVTLTVPMKIAKNAKPGEYKGWVNFYYMTCDEMTCIPPVDQKFEFAVTVEEADTVESLDTLVAVTDTLSEVSDTMDQDDTIDVAALDNAAGGPGSDEMVAGEKTIQEQIEDKKKEGLLPFILFAMGFGFLALTTPCVFPMIPITISFFTKREQNSRAHAVRDASIYALGIILTFTALGAIVSAIAGPTGVGDIATNPWINILIATIFVVFALSLFGLFEIQVPSGILNKLNAKANQGGGFSSILLMGFVFSLTSFTCTVPFVGPVLAGGATSGDWMWPVIGMAAFAFAFSLPFFVLAIFPALMKALPKSGGWLNAVKVTMGFVEIAAAMKFLSNTDLVWNWGVLTREIVLAVWIAIAVLAFLYLLGRFRLPHDTPIEKIGVARMLFSLGFLAIGFWLLTGLFGGRLGEVDAFLPPQEYPGKGNTSILATISGSPKPGATAAPHVEGSNIVAADGLTWFQDDYAAALEESKKTGKPIFVDFTGYTCTNCRWMERNVFTRDDVRNLMNQYVLVRLYTDRREESNKRNRQMQIDRFQTIDLPFYALFSPEDQVLGQSVFTRDVDKFKGFLQRGIEQGKIVGIAPDNGKSEEDFASR